MTARLDFAFKHFKDEMATVGRLLILYGELELTLMNCVSMARADLDAVLKALFRARGETQRIDIADALGRYIYHDLNLGTEFEMGIGAIRHCLKIRNQFAHCQWHDDRSGQLCFVALEEIAVGNAHIASLEGLTRQHVDMTLLLKQESYFRYADGLLAYVNFEGRKRVGQLSSHTVPKPRQLEQPLTCLPQGAR